MLFLEILLIELHTRCQYKRLCPSYNYVRHSFCLFLFKLIWKLSFNLPDIHIDFILEIVLLNVLMVLNAGVRCEAACDCGSWQQACRRHCFIERHIQVLPWWLVWIGEWRSERLCVVLMTYN